MQQAQVQGCRGAAAQRSRPGSAGARRRRRAPFLGPGFLCARPPAPCATCASAASLAACFSTQSLFICSHTTSFTCASSLVAT